MPSSNSVYPLTLFILNNFIKARNLNSGPLNTRVQLAIALVQGTAVYMSGAAEGVRCTACTALCGSPASPVPQKVPDAKFFCWTEHTGQFLQRSQTGWRGVGEWGVGKVICFHWAWRTHLEVIGKVQGLRKTPARHVGGLS